MGIILLCLPQKSHLILYPLLSSSTRYRWLVVTSVQRDCGGGRPTLRLAVRTLGAFLHSHICKPQTRTLERPFPSPSIVDCSRQLRVSGRFFKLKLCIAKRRMLLQTGPLLFNKYLDQISDSPCYGSMEQTGFAITHAAHYVLPI